MSSPQPRTRRRSRVPLVMLTREARDQASVVLPGEVPELVVAARIVEQGRVQGQPEWTGKAPFEVAGDGWRATVVRRPGRIRPRPRAWVVLAFERDDRGEAA